LREKAEDAGTPTTDYFESVKVVMAQIKEVRDGSLMAAQ